MKKVVLIGIIFGLICTIIPGDKESLLEIDASISPRRLSRGEEGKVIIKLQLEEGIRINPQPTFVIEIMPRDELNFPKNFFTASDLGMEILKENGMEFLNLSEPLEIPFTVNLKAVRGNHKLEGKIKYFAFSREEGWCLKNTAEFEASFYTRSTVIKKGTD